MGRPGRACRCGSGELFWRFSRGKPWAIVSDFQIRSRPLDGVVNEILKLSTLPFGFSFALRWLGVGSFESNVMAEWNGAAGGG